MRLAGEAQHAADRDVGMTDAWPEPERRPGRSAFFFQHLEHAADLRLAALDPYFRWLLPQHALIEQAHRLVTEPVRQRANPQGAITIRPGACDHGFCRPNQIVEIIQDRG